MNTENYNTFYFTDVGVCSTDRIMYDPIEKTVKIPARIVDGRECLYPPRYPNGLFPGVWRGNWIIRKSDIVER